LFFSLYASFLIVLLPQFVTEALGGRS